MSKTVVLMVYGDGDFGAMTFEQNYDAQEVYEEMVAEGVTQKTITHEDEKYRDEDLYVSIHVFGEIDMDFVSLIFDEFVDYDDLKRQNIIFVKEKE